MMSVFVKSWLCIGPCDKHVVCVSRFVMAKRVSLGVSCRACRFLIWVCAWENSWCKSDAPKYVFRSSLATSIHKSRLCCPSVAMSGLLDVEFRRWNCIGGTRAMQLQFTSISIQQFRKFKAETWMSRSVLTQYSDMPKSCLQLLGPQGFC